MDENKYPLAVAVEKAGYSILNFECALENVYDSESQKTIPSPVMRLKLTPAKGAKMLFIES